MVQALGILSHKIGRTVYYMLMQNAYFDEATFLQGTSRVAA